jgi:hypothetical protein
METALIITLLVLGLVAIAIGLFLNKHIDDL